MSSNSDSERTQPLEILRPLELPTVDTESADDLTPASGPEPEDDRSASGSAAEVSADSGDADTASVDAKEAEPETRPEDASPPGDDEQNLVAAQEVAPSGAGADKGDGPPPDRPKKPILAGVAIGGAVLLAIPVLLIGAGSHNDKKHRSAAAGNVLPGAGQQPPAGAFVSTSPSVTPTPSGTASPKTKKGKSKAKNGSAAGAAALAHSSRSRVPTGPKFSTVTRVLLHNVMTGLCADVPGNDNGGSNTAIGQYTCNGASNDNQLWDLVVNDKGGGPSGADLFTIRNSKDNY
ncbi:MAG TPA: RICIN domain-containing protein, partial [Actinoallomurus sp.]